MPTGRGEARSDQRASQVAAPPVPSQLVWGHPGHAAAAEIWRGLTLPGA